MRVNGVWVGWGLGDNSTADMTVRNAKAFMRKKFASYAGHLADTNLFDQQMQDVLSMMQDRYVAAGQLAIGSFIRGVLDLQTQYVMGFKRRPDAPKPIVFTIEGHLSSMWVGPCAFAASYLEGQGLCKWQPIGYDNVSLPFRNATGVNEFFRLLNATKMDDGYPFPLGTPWGFMPFSQGAIVGSQVFLKMRRDNHPRLKDLKRVVAFGNPYRQKDVIAPWIPDPPRPGTQGISDVRMTDTPPFWMEHARHGDIYAENTDDEIGLNKTAIYKIVSEGSWAGGPAGLLARMLDLLTNPFDGAIDIARSIISGAMFLGNMNSHGIYDLGPPIDWMRGVK